MLKGYNIRKAEDHRSAVHSEKHTAPMLPFAVLLPMPHGTMESLQRKQRPPVLRGDCCGRLGPRSKSKSAETEKKRELWIMEIAKPSDTPRNSGEF